MPVKNILQYKNDHDYYYSRPYDSRIGEKYRDWTGKHVPLKLYCMRLFLKIILSFLVLILSCRLLFAERIVGIAGNSGDGGSKPQISKEFPEFNSITDSYPDFTAISLPGTGKDGTNGRIAVNYNPYWTIKGIIAKGIGVGIAFEAAFLPFISVKINSMYLAVPQKIIGIHYVLSILNFSGGLRLYYLATGANGPFIGCHGGVFIVFANISSYEVTLPVIPMVLAETGYKWNFMRDRGFFLEPAVGYIFTDPIVNLNDSTPLGGMYFTLNIGWVF